MHIKPLKVLRDFYSYGTYYPETKKLVKKAKNWNFFQFVQEAIKEKEIPIEFTSLLRLYEKIKDAKIFQSFGGEISDEEAQQIYNAAKKMGFTIIYDKTYYGDVYRETTRYILAIDNAHVNAIKMLVRFLKEGHIKFEKNFWCHNFDDPEGFSI